MYHLAEIVRDARRDMDDRVGVRASGAAGSGGHDDGSGSGGGNGSDGRAVALAASAASASSWAAYTPLPFLYALGQQIHQTMQRKAPDLVKRAAVLMRDHVADTLTASQHAVHEFRVVTTRRGQVLFYSVKSTVETLPLPAPVEPLRSHVCVPVLNGVEGFAQFVTSEELPELYFVAKTSMARHVVLRHLVVPPLAATEKLVRYLVILPTQVVFPSREEIESRTDLFLDVSTSRVQSLVEYIYSATEVLDQHWSMVQWNILGRGPYESLATERRQDVIRSIYQRVRIIESRYKLYEFMASVKLQNEMLYADLLRAFPLTSGVPLLEDQVRANAQLRHELEIYDEDAFPCWFYRKIDVVEDGSNTTVSISATGSTTSTSTTNSNCKWVEFPPHENRRLERYYRFYQRQKALHGGPLPSPIVVVDEGRHEVNVDSMDMKPVYWTAIEKMEVRRSMWLYAQRNYGLAPYNPPAAQVLEQAFTYYLAYYEEEKQRLLEIAKKRGDRNAARTAAMGCTMSIPVEGHLVEFKGPNDIMQYKRLLAGTTPFTSKRRVYRGDPRIRSDPKNLELWKRGMVYSDKKGITPNEDDADIEEDVDHLVLIVHGIGDALKTIDIINVVTLRSIIDCAASLRGLHTEALRSSHFDKLGDKRPRTEFLPIEWHSKLHIDGLDSAIRDVTLPAIPKLREFANDTILDVLFFMSPMFHRVILEHVATEMNRVFELFQSRNRGWGDPHARASKKKVSIIAHSLGSIISFDVLNHQPPLQRPVKMPFQGDPITESTEDDDDSDRDDDLGCHNDNHVRHVALDSDSEDSDGSNDSCDNANGFEAMLIKQLRERSRSDSECVRARHLLNGRSKQPPKSHQQANGHSNLHQPKQQHAQSNGARVSNGKKANGIVVSTKKHVPVASSKSTTVPHLRKRSSHSATNGNASAKTTTTSSSSKSRKAASLSSSSSPPLPPRRRKRSRSGGANAGFSAPSKSSDVPHDVPVLAFAVENLFCFGSPVGLFLNVRGQKITRDFRLPTCKRVFNIYHPYDPVAYRIEPIVNPRRAHSKAAIIRTFEGKLRFQYQIRNSFRRMWQKLRQWRRNFETQVESTVRSVGLVETAVTAPDHHDGLATSSEMVQGETPPAAAAGTAGRFVSATEREDGEYGSGRLDVFGRLCQGLPIDYSLQENEIEIANEYLFALTSHVIYWGNRDASLFVAQKMILEPAVASDDDEDEEDEEQNALLGGMATSGSISPAFCAFPSRPRDEDA